MTRLAAGTPVSGPYSSYTAEQLNTLERLKDPTFTLGVARAKYANTLLLPDGSQSNDVAGMIDAAKKQLSAILAGDLTEPATLDAAKRTAEKVQEIVDHVALGFFLFVVDADQLPVVYFQAAVKGNPNLPPKER